MKLHEYQEDAKNWILEHPYCGLFLDMGLGKTVITLTALDEMIFERFTVSKALVVAPKRVAEDVWQTEAAKWDHLKRLRVVEILGTPKERRTALKEDGELYVITRDNIPWLVKELGKDWSFDCLIIDELSSFKSHAAKRFKALKSVRPAIDRVIGLTGTPAPNGYIDLWAQIYLLDRGERLGRTITAFRDQYCTVKPWATFTQYLLRDGAEGEIDGKIEDICISMKAKDYLDLKAPTVIERKVKLSKPHFKKYKELERDYVLSLGDAQITALSAAAVTNKLLQLANGAVYDENKGTHIVHDEKLDALEEILEEAGGENILVFYQFQSDKARILERFPECVTLEGGKEIKEWNSGKIKMLLAHPASCGHGLNLQEGGSIIVWFGLTWSLELYLQANARLQRQGQKKPVRIYHLLTDGTVDERVMAALSGKNFRQEELLEHLRAELKGGKQ